MSGPPVEVLAEGAPGFGVEFDDGPPCRLCVLARGITLPVRCWKHPEDVICLRHRRWTGPGSDDDCQPDLSSQPGILQAHRQHIRIVRRHGRDDTAFAFAVAEHICRWWHRLRQHDAGFYERMLAFHGPGWQPAPTSPTTAAAVYPQAVALTRLLAAPHWQAMSASRQAGQREAFIAEVRRTVAPGYRWPQPRRPADPLETWIDERYISGYRPALFSFHTWAAPKDLRDA